MVTNEIIVSTWEKFEHIFVTKITILQDMHSPDQEEQFQLYFTPGGTHIFSWIRMLDVDGWVGHFPKSVKFW